LTLDRLRAHLARRGISVSLASLSDWQKRRQPARAAELVARGAGAELLDTLPGAADNDVELVSAQHKMVIGASGHTTSLWTRTLVRALRDGVDRYLVRYYGNPGCDPALAA
jgi:hypothetical protein